MCNTRVLTSSADIYNSQRIPSNTFFDLRPSTRPKRSWDASTSTRTRAAHATTAGAAWTSARASFERLPCEPHAMDADRRQHGDTTGRLDMGPNCNSQLCGNGRIVRGALQSLSLHAGTLLHNTTSGPMDAGSGVPHVHFCAIHRQRQLPEMIRSSPRAPGDTGQYGKVASDLVCATATGNRATV